MQSGKEEVDSQEREKKNNMEAAEKYYLKAIECEDSDPYGLMNLAVICSNRNEFSDANAYFKKALAIDQENPDIHYIYAYFLSKSGGNEILSERHYWECIKLNPAHRKALNNMGLIQMRKGKYDEAVRYFHKAYSLERGNPDIIVNLAAAATGRKSRICSSATCEMLKCVTAVSRPPDAHARASSGRPTNSSRPFVHAAASFVGARRPLRPSWTMSRLPAMSDAIVGSPVASASISASGSASLSDGNRK